MRSVRAMSSSFSDLSDSSIESEGGDPRSQPSHGTLRRKARHIRCRIQERSSRDIFLFLVAFRILNALCVRTFFQPDEFFQSLEPAWQIAFGHGTGAWITWEWKHHLRSSIHPYIFAGVYWIANQIGQCLHLSPLSRADLLIAAPKTAQGVFAALGDFYTWKLAGKVYGAASESAWWALGLTVLSPWQWFCSTRTFSNCLEITLTVIALYYWPWRWNLPETPAHRVTSSRAPQLELRNLRICLLLAAFASILRPTNLIIWLSVVSLTLAGTVSEGGFPSRKHVILIRESLLCGFLVLFLALVADRTYYGSWTLPPFKFLYFNIAQSLAVFYGKNDWHYYLSQGYPLLLTTALPFTLTGIFVSYTVAPDAQDTVRGLTRRQLATISLIMPAVLSLISHKEVRFIYPLLPALHVLTAPALASFFGPAVSSSSGSYSPRRLVLSFLVVVNLAIAFYTTIIHASGPLNVLDFFRQQQESVSRQVDAQNSLPRPPFVSYFSAPQKLDKSLTVGFLMPCHSTPWRSHFVFPSIRAWALSCEPPINLNASKRARYLDEADIFYADPSSFLRSNMVGGLGNFPRTPTYQQQSNPLVEEFTASGEIKHHWPDHLVFFAQLEPTMISLLRASSYAECYRTWNTAWHDDWRRKGDIIVWCLDPALQREWREKNKQVQAHEDGWESLMQSNIKRFDTVFEQLKKESMGAWSTGKKKKGWTERIFSRPRGWSFRSKKSLSMYVPWSEDTRASSFWRWSWPWGKKRKPSWTDAIWEWYDKVLSDNSESEPSDLWS